jgi:uncharacterized glyoxalase superfamily protein PhnB
LPREAQLSERRVKTLRDVAAAACAADLTALWGVSAVDTRVSSLFVLFCDFTRGDAMPKMKFDAVSVTTTDMEAATSFYALLGFAFPTFERDAQHVEAITAAGEVRLMIDDRLLIKTLTGKDPAPATHSSFAIKCERPAAVDAAVLAIRNAGFAVVKEPWDAFWGQRYAIVADPDGYMSDLFAPL